MNIYSITLQRSFSAKCWFLFCVKSQVHFLIASEYNGRYSNAVNSPRHYEFVFVFSERTYCAPLVNLQSLPLWRTYNGQRKWRSSLVTCQHSRTVVHNNCTSFPHQFFPSYLSITHCLVASSKQIYLSGMCYSMLLLLKLFVEAVSKHIILLSKSFAVIVVLLFINI
jgi:hypothetical protein